MTMKRILFAAALFAALDAAAQLPAEIRIDKRSLRPTTANGRNLRAARL